MHDTYLTDILKEKIGSNHPQLARLTELFAEYIVVRTIEDMSEQSIELVENSLHQNVGTTSESTLDLLLKIYPESKENIANYINDFMEKYV